MLYEIDKTLLPRARREIGGFHEATEWYMNWIPIPYQYAFHHIKQMNTTLLAGIASGKTVGHAASMLIDCLSIPYFKALNTSVTAKQAELPFVQFLSWYEGNDRLEHLIEDVKLRPWPIVKFKNFSEWEFRTAGTDARFIKGHEYDRIGFDEAGLDFLGEIVKVLRGRLRGVRTDGTKRMARLDILTSPTDAYWLRERYERGIPDTEKSDLKHYLSMKVKTGDNTHLTQAQLDLMYAEFTDEMVHVEMDAEFPDYGMSLFPKGHVNACTDLSLNDLAYISMNPDDGSVARRGFVVEEHPRHGITKWEMPYNAKGLYIMAGDPGTDGPPKRNSATVGVVDINQSPARLVYFHWIDGKGSYNPFLTSYKYAIDKYRPQMKLLDTTGTQSAIRELAFENYGVVVDGVNFSHEKDGALNSLNLAITNHEISWPLIKGLVRQISTYTRENDRKSDFPQDITMLLAMLALGMRYAPVRRDDDYQSSSVASRSRRHRTSRGRRANVR
jgi:hypothetical protein